MTAQVFWIDLIHQVLKEAVDRYSFFLKSDARQPVSMYGGRGLVKLHTYLYKSFGCCVMLTTSRYLVIGFQFLTDTQSRKATIHRRY